MGKQNNCQSTWQQAEGGLENDSNRHASAHVTCFTFMDNSMKSSENNRKRRSLMLKEKEPFPGLLEYQQPDRQEETQEPNLQHHCSQHPKWI